MCRGVAGKVHYSSKWAHLALVAARGDRPIQLGLPCFGDHCGNVVPLLKRAGSTVEEGGHCEEGPPRGRRGLTMMQVVVAHLLPPPPRGRVVNPNHSP